MRLWRGICKEETRSVEIGVSFRSVIVGIL